MPKRSPVNTVVVHRDGKRVVPPIGKPFDFTADEIADFERILPGSLAKVTRVVEDDDDSGERVRAPAVVRDSDDGEPDADGGKAKAPAKAAGKAKAPAKDDDDGL